MKKWICHVAALFVITACIVCSCTSSPRDLTVKELSPGENEISFKVDKNYLMLPIQQNAPEKTLSIYAGDQFHTSYAIRLAEDTVDYLMPLDLRRWPKDTPIRITLAEPNQQAVWMDSLQLVSTFNFTYAEQFRPIYHFTPPYGWMNDPNGLVYQDGEYHLFYQYNPFGTVWGNMHWGHAVSTDLFTWKHRPIALEPDSLGTIYSGCAVIDKHNSAGFGKDAMILFYTSAGDAQVQSMAYSLDKGQSFTKYAGNPILTNPAKKDFRDPKVIWYHPDQKWIMIVAAGNEMEFYSSVNLKDWTYESAFGANAGAHGGVWECPDLFELPVDRDSTRMKWVLLSNINPGGIQGGSATQYFVGDFDGKTFTNSNDSSVVRWMDWGKDHYAAVTWADAPENRRISIAWMSNWQYAQQVPTVIFRSSKSVPRELTLDDYGDDILLYAYPARQIDKIQGRVKDFNSFDIKKESAINPLLEENSGAYELSFLLEPGESRNIGITLSNQLNEFVNVIFDLNKGVLSFDRTRSGIVNFSPDFPTQITAPLPVKDLYEVRILVDKASVELFVDGGALNMTNLVFPNACYNILGFSSKQNGARINELSVTVLEKSMAEIADWQLAE